MKGPNEVEDAGAADETCDVIATDLQKSEDAAKGRRMITDGNNNEWIGICIDFQKYTAEVSLIGELMATRYD